MIGLLFILKCVLYIQYCKKNPRRAEKKNVHAARDGTAAGRHGVAPREHLIIATKKMYLVHWSTSQRVHRSTGPRFSRLYS